MTKMPEKSRALGMYRKMCLIRQSEEAIYYLFLEGIMPGTIHQSHGQEASAVGMIYDLRKSDYMLSTHRPMGHDLAKGVTLRSIMCEMFGRKEGCCKGKGGAMHLGSIDVGAVTANAIVGGNLPIAAGIALRCKMLKTDDIAMAFFGDGASNEGSFHESMNAAAVWKLPVVYVCENNLYGATTSIKLTCKLEHVAAGRGSAYGIPAEVVDGNDVLAVNEAAARAIERARKGKGPTILELKTYRIGGHSRNDACGYRSKEEEERWFALDPIKLFERRLINEKVATEEELQAVKDEIQNQIDDEIEYAKQCPFAEPEEAMRDIYWEGK